jgi:hypothetical protein
MSQNFGITMPAAHTAQTLRAPVRYVVVIDSGGSMVARLFLADRALVNECDAAAAEVANTTAGLRPALGAQGREWDAALKGYSAQERAGAEVYTLAT